MASIGTPKSISTGPQERQDFSWKTHLTTSFFSYTLEPKGQSLEFRRPAQCEVPALSRHEVRKQRMGIGRLLIPTRLTGLSRLVVDGLEGSSASAPSSPGTFLDPKL